MCTGTYHICSIKHTVISMLKNFFICFFDNDKPVAPPSGTGVAISSITRQMEIPNVVTFIAN